jgi:hypothetical protein
MSGDEKERVVEWKTIRPSERAGVVEWHGDTRPKLSDSRPPALPKTIRPSERAGAVEWRGDAHPEPSDAPSTSITEKTLQHEKTK